MPTFGSGTQLSRGKKVRISNRKLAVLNFATNFILTTDGRLLKFKEFISNESNDETRFANGGISEEDEFEMTETITHADI